LQSSNAIMAALGKWLNLVMSLDKTKQKLFLILVFGQYFIVFLDKSDAALCAIINIDNHHLVDLILQFLLASI